MSDISTRIEKCSKEIKSKFPHRAYRSAKDNHDDGIREICSKYKLKMSFIKKLLVI